MGQNINSNGKRETIFCFSLPLSNNINNRYKNMNDFYNNDNGDSQ